MSKEITKRDDLLTPDTITKEDIKKLFCPNATDKELTIFSQIAKLYGLNPLKREIYLVKYGSSPAQTITGYEVYLKRAERSKKYAGFKVWTEGEAPKMKACIEVRRNDWKEPLYHEVEYTEYVQKTSAGQLTRFWREKPKTMLKKVCISQAFRFAFPDELAGMPYTREEMPQGEVVDVSTSAKPQIAKPEALAELQVGPEQPQKEPEQPQDTKEPKKPETPLKTKTKGIQARFKDALVSLGKDQYYLILKNHGYESVANVKKSEIAEEILVDMGQAMSIQNLVNEEEGND